MKHPAKVINPSAIHCFSEIFLETLTIQLISYQPESNAICWKPPWCADVYTQALILNQACKSKREGDTINLVLNMIVLRTNHNYAAKSR